MSHVSTKDTFLDSPAAAPERGGLASWEEGLRRGEARAGTGLEIARNIAFTQINLEELEILRCCCGGCCFMESS